MYMREFRQRVSSFGWSDTQSRITEALRAPFLKVPCAPKWFDFECPIIETTKLLSRNSLRYLSKVNLPIALTS